MARVNTAVLEKQDMPDIRKFWEWVLSEKAKRPKLSYGKMAEKARAQNVTLDRSAIVKAIAHNSVPSPEMIRLIAAAFDMSIEDVEVQIGYKARVSHDVVDNRPLLIRVITNARQMSDEELETIAATQEAMIEQKKRKLRNHNGGKRR